MERKQNMVEKNVEAFGEVKAQHDTTKRMQKAHDKQFGFSHFPFTHGEELEKARAEHKTAFRAE